MRVLWEDAVCESVTGQEQGGCVILGEDADWKLPEDSVFAGELRDAINEALRHLEPVEETVLKMLYGVGMLVDHTPTEIAAYLGLTERRIKEIEGRALQRLQSASFSIRLRGMTIE